MRRLVALAVLSSIGAVGCAMDVGDTDSSEPLGSTQEALSLNVESSFSQVLWFAAHKQKVSHVCELTLLNPTMGTSITFTEIIDGKVGATMGVVWEGLPIGPIWGFAGPWDRVEVTGCTMLPCRIAAKMTTVGHVAGKELLGCTIEATTMLGPVATGLVGGALLEPLQKDDNQRYRQEVTQNSAHSRMGNVCTFEQHGLSANRTELVDHAVLADYAVLGTLAGVPVWSYMWPTILPSIPPVQYKVGLDAKGPTRLARVQSVVPRDGTVKPGNVMFCMGRLAASSGGGGDLFAVNQGSMSDPGQGMTLL